MGTELNQIRYWNLQYWIPPDWWPAIVGWKVGMEIHWGAFCTIVWGIFLKRVTSEGPVNYILHLQYILYIYIIYNYIISRYLYSFAQINAIGIKSPSWIPHLILAMYHFPDVVGIPSQGVAPRSLPSSGKRKRRQSNAWRRIFQWANGIGLDDPP